MHFPSALLHFADTAHNYVADMAHVSAHIGQSTGTDGAPLSQWLYSDEFVSQQHLAGDARDEHVAVGICAGATVVVLKECPPGSNLPHEASLLGDILAGHHQSTA
jgi:hypothetical protein